MKPAAATVTGMSNQQHGVVSVAGAPPAEPSNTKDTVISVLISLVLAFVFRGFVVEGFQIPTGSMAPTLLGAHMRFQSPVTGAQWTVAPWEYLDGGFDFPAPVQQMGREGPIVVHDPMSNYRLSPRAMPTLSGDRVFVLKYLFSIFDPARFDIVVFKNPQKPQENVIKRLVGLPNEQVAIVDGDVFVRPASSADDSLQPWEGQGWSIARKPEQVQRAVWQPIFESQYTPASARIDGRQWFYCPWTPSTPGWEMTDRPTYSYGQSSPTRLDWDIERWPLVDRFPYNEADLRSQVGPSAVLLGSMWRPTYPHQGPMLYYPVSDLRLAAGVKPEATGLQGAFNIVARGHQFQALLAEGIATINMREDPAIVGEDRPWTALATAQVPGLFTPGRVSMVEFWHVDQSLKVWIDGRLVVHAQYAWSPAQRIAHAMGLTLRDIEESTAGGTRPGVLVDGTKYRRPGVSIAFQGSPLTLSRVGMWRDLHYQATNKGGIAGPPGLTTDPRTVLTTSPDQFFCCGDNSPSSLDGRAWNSVDPWVAAEFDSTVGVVHRSLLIGKAFFVYLPAADPNRRIPIPDVGRMRLIW